MAYLYELKDWLLAGGTVDFGGYTLKEKDGVLVNAATEEMVPASVYYSMQVNGWNAVNFALTIEESKWYRGSDSQLYKVVDVVTTNKGNMAVCINAKRDNIQLTTLGGRGKYIYLVEEVADPEITVELGE